MTRHDDAVGATRHETLNPPHQTERLGQLALGLEILEAPAVAALDLGVLPGEVADDLEEQALPAERRDQPGREPAATGSWAKMRLAPRLTFQSWQK